MTNAQRVLTVTVLDRQGQQHEFTCLLHKPEIGYDFLSAIEANSSILLKASIREGNKSFALSSDSGSLLNVLQLLAQENQLVLEQLPHHILPDGVNQLKWQRITQHQAYIAELEIMRSQVMELLSLTTDNFSDGPRKDRLTIRYQAKIANLDFQLVQAKLSLKIMLGRVERSNHDAWLNTAVQPVP